MNKPISRVAHGFLDYSAAPLVATAPALLGFKEEKSAANLAYVVGTSIAALTASTRAEWGLFKAIPFKTHLTIDLVTAATALTAPWLFGFAKNTKARNAFLGIGATLLLTGLLTKPEEMPKYR
ncbi:hypothetical protein [uncultured Hymenobacter sp.]|uniref:SPW repeat domain-containing protein n=1 Tax=uncultured Hymenobacter sp. TaxID=170016 RepID=UPI0035C98649